MHPILQFVADHKAILWVLLTLGAIGILQTTYLFRTVQSRSHRLADSSFVRQSGGWPDWYIRLFKWCADSLVVCGLTLVWSAVLTVAAVAGLFAL